jgi:hypothetical protein
MRPDSWLKKAFFTREGLVSVVALACLCKTWHDQRSSNRHLEKVVNFHKAVEEFLQKFKSKGPKADKELKGRVMEKSSLMTLCQDKMRELDQLQITPFHRDQFKKALIEIRKTLQEEEIDSRPFVRAIEFIETFVAASLREIEKTKAEEIEKAEKAKEIEKKPEEKPEEKSEILQALADLDISGWSFEWNKQLASLKDDLNDPGRIKKWLKQSLKEMCEELLEFIDREHFSSKQQVFLFDLNNELMSHLRGENPFGRWEGQEAWASSEEVLKGAKIDLRWIWGVLVYPEPILLPQSEAFKGALERLEGLKRDPLKSWQPVSLTYLQLGLICVLFGMISTFAKR